jgi:hypothetical protein
MINTNKYLNKFNLKLNKKENEFIFKSEKYKIINVYLGKYEIGEIKVFPDLTYYTAVNTYLHKYFKNFDEAIIFLIDENKKYAFMSKAKNLIKAVILDYGKKKITDTACINEIKDILNCLEIKLKSKFNIKNGVFE